MNLKNTQNLAYKWHVKHKWRNRILKKYGFEKTALSGCLLVTSSIRHWCARKVLIIFSHKKGLWSEEVCQSFQTEVGLFHLWISCWRRSTIYTQTKLLCWKLYIIFGARNIVVYFSKTIRQFLLICFNVCMWQNWHVFCWSIAIYFGVHSLPGHCSVK